MDDLIKQGAAAFKTGDLVNARIFLADAIKQFPDDERAWGWMYNVCSTDEERILCLKQMIRLNPQNEKARNMLLGLDKQTQSPMVANSESMPAQEQEKSLELIQSTLASGLSQTDLSQTKTKNLSTTDEKTIIDLLQKQNEILENLRVLLYHSTESKSEKEYRLRTRIVDIDMSISSMANLMFKWFIASIPVGIVMGFIFFILSSCLAVGMFR